ncbi:MAG TPA: AI-2E family transporter [Roseiarcus sp.]|nr:AI-2E family transporter [Roseiarcus sp.]
MTRIPDNEGVSPPLIQLSDLAIWAQIALAAIAAGFVLYAGRDLLLPIISAFVVGVMVSPAARFLEQYRFPRIVSALLIVCATAGLIALIVALISAPLADWVARLPELSSSLKNKLHFLDGLRDWWREVETMLGINPKSASSMLPTPNLNWLPATFGFLSSTLTGFPFFLVVLLLFVASWPDLRRGLVLTFAQRESRLIALKILNEIEAKLASYLRTVSLINLCVGLATGVICLITGTPDAIGLGVLAATFNFIPIIGPIAMAIILLVVGVVSAPTLGAGVIPFAGFVLVITLEGQFITPSIIGRHLSLNGLAVLLSLAFWAWLWGPLGAFLSSPLLIVGLILKEHLAPEEPG